MNHLATGSVIASATEFGEISPVIRDSAPTTPRLAALFSSALHINCFLMYGFSIRCGDPGTEYL